MPPPPTDKANLPGGAGMQRETVAVTLVALNTLQVGDVISARRLADEAVPTMAGWHRVMALNVRARVAVAEGRPGTRRTRRARGARMCGRSTSTTLRSRSSQCLAALSGDSGSYQEAVRLFGAAEALRQQTTEVRFGIFQSGYDASCAAARDALGIDAFHAAWAEGPALSIEEAIAYAQRGRGERKRHRLAGRRSRRPNSTSSGWSVRGSATKTSPPGCSYRHEPCRPTSRTSTRSSGCRRGCNWRRRPPRRT